MQRSATVRPFRRAGLKILAASMNSPLSATAQYYRRICRLEQPFDVCSGSTPAARSLLHEWPESARRGHSLPAHRPTARVSKAALRENEPATAALPRDFNDPNAKAS